MNAGEPESASLIAQRILRELRLGDDDRRREAARRIESDPTLREQVERLMAATVDSLPSTVVGADRARPRRVGAYCLLEELGSGGMGAVFLAERDVDGTLQRVALKLLHGIPTQELRRRFSRERALLAGLNHPQIAALLDGGETEDGQPYLVMEYVEGEPITEWVRRTGPDLSTRLRTLVRVCRAVEHAHQRLVLHRDIKPGNVLVRADGDPVLLDFGIGRELGGVHGLTETATLAFTPAYAAPEQFTGRGLTTATDVFGLGALLYEVLSGASLADLRRDGTALPLPSVAAPDPQLRDRLRGDLDRIVAKAMQAEPERRYAGAAGLGDDLERFLDGRPVHATPDSLGYRVAKFVGRHRAAVVVAGLALTLGAGFVWRLDIERTRARAAEVIAQRESVSARLARDFLVSVFQSASPRETLGQPVSPRDLLDRARARVQSELGSDRAAAVSTWMALSDTYNALGEPGAAAQAAEQALGYTAGDDAAQRLQRADVIEALGAAYNQLGRYPEAVPLYEELLRLREELSADDPVALANTYGELGYAAQQYGEHERSAQWLSRALVLLDSQRSRNRGDAEDRCYVLAGLAVAAASGGDEAGARHWLGVAQAAREAIDPSHPSGLFVLRASARLAELQGRFDESVSELQAASELARRVIGADASTVAGIENDLGVALNGLGRYREALEHLERARSMYLRRTTGADANVAHLDANIGAIHESLGDYVQAIEYARRALAVFASEGMTQVDMRRQSRVNLARGLSFAGQHAQALDEIRRALEEGIASEGRESLTHQLDRFRYAGILRRAGELDAASQELDSCSPAILGVVGAEHPLKLHLLRLRALITRDRGDLKAARLQFEHALSFADLTADADPIATAEARVELAALLAVSEQSRARDLLDQALPILREALLPIAPARIEAERLQAALQP